MLEASLTAGTPDVTAFAALIVVHTVPENNNACSTVDLA